MLGKTLGTKLSGKADVLGGVILIGIGIVSWGRECDFFSVSGGRLRKYAV
mgnify:CR=1 FL=1